MWVAGLVSSVEVIEHRAAVPGRTGLVLELVSLRKALTRAPSKTLSNAEIIFVINLSVMHTLIFLKLGENWGY